MAEDVGQREEGAAGMVDADEGGMRDDVQRLRAAIFRMRAPADVGEQAGRVAVARLVLGLVDAEGGEGRAGPVGQFVRVRHRAGAQQGQFLGRRDQRIGRAAPPATAASRGSLRARRAPTPRSSTGCIAAMISCSTMAP